MPVSWWPFSRKSPSLVDPPKLIEAAPVPVVAVDVRPDPAPVDAPMPAGVAWCARFPGSDRLEDLSPPFREGAIAFVRHLRGLGCRVTITSTLRPEPRAWLMRMTWDLVKGLVEIDEIPVRPDIRITWTLAGALDMFHGYALKARPALDSRHIQGLAMDVKIDDWMGSDADLYALGAEYGVRKLPGDPVHYSIDGH